jgi:hypothetical protein
MRGADEVEVIGRCGVQRCYPDAAVNHLRPFQPSREACAALEDAVPFSPLMK